MNAWILGLVSTNAVLHIEALRPHEASRGYASIMSLNQLHFYTFRDFMVEFGRTYAEGTDEYARREALFNESLDAVIKFQSRADRSWQMGVNRFMDYTRSEQKRMLGYKGTPTRKVTQQNDALVDFNKFEPLPKYFNVGVRGSQLQALVRDQGVCGSCWAMAATTVLEGQMEANSTLMRELAKLHGANASGVPVVPQLSVQAVVSCTLNPRHCGGTGGCDGATAELAYEMVEQRGGLPFAALWEYESHTGYHAPCQGQLFSEARIGISGYNMVPQNKVNPLKQALLSTGGPIVVSVDATNWFFYMQGVYSDTRYGGTGDFTVNHAVTLVGYSEPRDGSLGFWTIKNSWGSSWGEFGYIRLEMKRNEEEHCGWDTNTHEGSACDGDPNTAWVCGTCGILYDASYPTGVYLK